MANLLLTLDELFGSGIGHLRSIQTSKESLNDSKPTMRCTRLLCEKIEIFSSFLNDPQFVGSKRSEYGAFDTSVKELELLLRDIDEFISNMCAEEDSVSTQKLRTDDSFRQLRATSFAIFNQRIHRLMAILLPEVEIDVEARRLELVEEHVTIMLEDLVKRLQEDHAATQSGIHDIKALIQGLSLNQQLMVDSMTAKGATLEDSYQLEPAQRNSIILVIGMLRI
jgi:hypothetical protein